MTRYGMFGKLTARPGEGDALEAMLLEAADQLAAVDDCELYVVSRTPDEPEAVWVTEIWSSAEAHTASLEIPAVKELIAKAMPILVGRPEATVVAPVGGKFTPA